MKTIKILTHPVTRVLLCLIFIYLIFLESIWFFEHEWVFSDNILIKAAQYFLYTASGLFAASSPLLIISCLVFFVRLNK